MDTTNKPGAGSQMLGSYELLQLLGEGSMGRVFLARHTRLGRKVAIKILRPEHTRDRSVVQRFLQEARTVNQINHENIVEVFDFVEEPGGGEVWCVMELLQGSSLTAYMESGVSVVRAADLLQQICSALQAAHTLGVVHRDLKPDNIFVCNKNGRDHVKVLDFGVAKLLRLITASPAKGGTMDGAIVGTPAYMSPEQAAGVEIDHRSDLFGLGIIAYEMLTGHTPFSGDNFGQLAVAIITKPTPKLPSTTIGGEKIPSDLAEVVMKCLEKQPEKRPQSAGEIAAILSGLSAVEFEPPKPSRLLPALLGITGLLAVCVAVGAYLLLQRKPEAVALPAPVAVVAPPQPTPPPVPAKVTLAIASTPAGAKVVRTDTGEELGVTPLSKEFAAAETELPLRLELEGHEAAERKASLKANAAFEVALVAVPAPVPDAPPPAAKTEPAVPAAGPKKPSGPKQQVNPDGVMDPFAQ
ncbi:MAG TPA: serine/threonine-protein kinase [Myxococcales bacterium]